MRSRGVVSSSHGKWGKGELNWWRPTHKNETFEEMNQTGGYAKKKTSNSLSVLGMNGGQPYPYPGGWTTNSRLKE